VVPAGHPLDEADEPLPLSALDGMELLLPAPGTALREEINAAAAVAGVTLRASMELDGLRMIASLTFDGHGPSVLPATAVPAHLRAQFARLRIDGLPRRRVGVALRVRGLPSAPTRALIDVLYASVQDPMHVPEGLHPAVRERRR
jgi:DNA-binding transcriptional LysR family regulator